MMKRKTAAKFMTLILCAVTLLNAAALYGCKKEGEIAPEVAQRVTNVYRSDFLSFPENYNPAGMLSYFDGRLYMPCREVIDQTTYLTRTVLYSVDTKGENPQSVPIELGAESDYMIINNLLQFPDGSIIIVASVYKQNIAEVQSFQLIKKAPDGSTVFSINLEPMFPDSGIVTNNPNGSFYINLAALDEEGNIYLGGGHSQGTSALVCLSPDGKKLFDIIITGFLSDIAVGADGRVFVKYRYTVRAGTEIRYIDIQKKLWAKNSRSRSLG